VATHIPTVGERTAELDFYMMQSGRSAGRKALVAAAVALTPIAIVLFIYVLASSAPEAEVAQASQNVPTTTQVAPSVDEPVVAASDAEEATEEVAEASTEAPRTAVAALEAETVARPGAAVSRPASSTSQFLGSLGDDSPKSKKSKASKKDKTASSDKPKGKGTIVAMAVGASCQFAVDGAGKGATSSVRVQVAAGRHTVSCQPVGGSRRSKTVTVEPGKAAVAVFKF
jgi:cytoskeletal protein RodZ